MSERGIYCDVDTTQVTTLFLNPARFAFGRRQFSEVVIDLTDMTPVVNDAFTGPMVFATGDLDDATTSTEHGYVFLAIDVGQGTNAGIYRLYRRTSAWNTLATDSGKVDPADGPVKLRLEAWDQGNQVVIRRWINDKFEGEYIDTATNRVTWKSSITPNGLSAPGISWGNNGTEDTLRFVQSIRAGNDPDIENQNVFYPHLYLFL